MRKLVLLDCDSFSHIELNEIDNFLRNKEFKANDAILLGGSNQNQKFCLDSFSLIKSMQFSQICEKSKERQLSIYGYKCGSWIAKNLLVNEKLCIYIFSKTKGVNNLALLCIKDGVGVYVLQECEYLFCSIDDDSKKLISTIELTRKQKIPSAQTEITTAPSWFKETYSEKELKIGFAINGDIQNSFGERLNFIPFPSKKIFSLGLIGDISLSRWQGNVSVYSLNVEIEYNSFPEGYYSIRSLKGHRTGKHEVAVNGKDISASNGKIKMQNGDSVSIGNLHLIFTCDLRETLIRYENAYKLIVRIENKLKSIAIKFTISECPGEIISDVVDSNGDLNWGKAYLRSYSYLFTYNWSSSNLDSLRAIFPSKSFFIYSFNQVNRIRNKIMHPSEGGISENEKETLVDFYLKISSLKN